MRKYVKFFLRALWISAVYTSTTYGVAWITNHTSNYDFFDVGWFAFIGAVSAFIWFEEVKNGN